MENLIFNWKILVVENGKHFFKINSNKWDDKYYVFCYVGYPSYMDAPQYLGEKYKDCVIYLKRKIKNRKYETIFEYSKQLHFYGDIQEEIHLIIEGKIFAEERKDKIKNLLGN